MSQNSTDLRARRTRKLLRDALLELIEERGFDALTVGEIAEHAMVSRSAFYRYYQDKYALVEQIFEEAMQTLLSDLSRHAHASPSSVDPKHASTPERWVKLFEHFAAYERLYRVLLSGKGSPWFATKIRAQLSEMREEREQECAFLEGREQAGNLHVAASRLVSALIDALLIDTVVWWLEQGRPYPPKEIATYCWHLIVALLKEASTWQ
jgi:AcrR family transcriptional regulator